MPAEYVHLSLAARSADALALPAAVRPAFFLGTVAADVNNPLGWPREATHFWPNAGGDVSGALTLLARHPSLRASSLAPAERAFTAGYLGHLITDEQEILTISRPYVQPEAVRRADGAPGANRRELRLASLIVVDAAVEADDPRPMRRSVDELRAVG